MVYDCVDLFHTTHIIHFHQVSRSSDTPASKLFIFSHQLPLGVGAEKGRLRGETGTYIGCPPHTPHRAYYSYYYYFHSLKLFNFISSIITLDDYPAPLHAGTDSRLSSEPTEDLLGGREWTENGERRTVEKENEGLKWRITEKYMGKRDELKIKRIYQENAQMHSFNPMCQTQGSHYYVICILSIIWINPNELITYTRSADSSYSSR